MIDLGKLANLLLGRGEEEREIRRYVKNVRRDGKKYGYLYRTQDINDEWSLTQERNDILEEVEEEKLLDVLAEQAKSARDDEKVRLFSEFAAIDSDKSLEKLIELENEYPERTFVAMLKFLDTDVSEELVEFAIDNPDVVEKVIAYPSGLNSKLEILYKNRGKLSTSLRLKLIDSKVSEKAEKSDLNELSELVGTNDLPIDLRQDIFSSMYRSGKSSNELYTLFLEEAQRICKSDFPNELKQDALRYLSRVDGGEATEFLESFDYSGLETDKDELLNIAKGGKKVDEIQFELSGLEYEDTDYDPVGGAIRSKLDFFADGENLMENGYEEYELAETVKHLLEALLELEDKPRSEYVGFHCNFGHINCPGNRWDLRNRGGRIIIETEGPEEKTGPYSVDRRDFMEEILRLSIKVEGFMGEKEIESAAEVEKKELEELISKVENLLK